MSSLHTLSLYTHILVGLLALITFWVAAFAKKGGVLHRRIGRYFVRTMTLTSWTGLILSSMMMLSPMAIRFPNGYDGEDLAQILHITQVLGVFLFYISILVWTDTRHSVLVLEAKHDHHKLKQPLHLMLMSMLVIGAFGLAYLGWRTHMTLLMIFAVIGAISGVRMLRYTFSTPTKPRAWLLAHLGSMCRAGIGVHTAIFAFGGRRVMSEIFSGDLMMIPWILPGVVGTVVISWLTRRYALQNIEKSWQKTEKPEQKTETLPVKPDRI